MQEDNVTDRGHRFLPVAVVMLLVLARESPKGPEGVEVGSGGIVVGVVVVVRERLTNLQ